MLQSSITAWLKKPAIVMKADQPPPAPASTPVPFAHAQPTVSGPEPNSAPTVDSASGPSPKLPTAPLFSTPPLPDNVELAPLTQELIPSFKRILNLTLPVSYPAVFFTESMEEPFHSITLMALWHAAPADGTPLASIEKPRLVGAIRCRILPSANLYISTISLLAPYRSHGVATHLLQRIVAKAVEVHGVRCVTAHVWEANEDGLEWYKKRGFEIIGKEDAYYHKLKPQGAFLVRKWIGVADLLAHPDEVSVVNR
ncbi:uncharacterized protein N0V89_004316 [Didymosphaeria variabile]|uniref:N-acetyltransferase domain-containing protein n=1 Tax=Didymosphaeria variabile TaxID=1932322 RepID=A0A9W8XS92_9PLEO|nr:uncharacterized protein N0V89_004316 [Didymosphaeria variabile]KAJ4356285.1 hypothetical protein N0V89_004316 [Didymosphaeria variabile]